MIRDRDVTVVGLGVSGFSAAKFLHEKEAKLKVTDNSDTPQVHQRREELERIGIECEIGRHTEGFLEGTGLLVVSPGVENDSLPIRWAEERTIPIISEIELGYRFSNGTIIAVSGTNGKSTVTALIGEILKKAEKEVFVCGNIGVPFTSVVSSAGKESIIVLEISSFQLERIDKFKPHIAVMLNITEDHLDRYKDFDEYVNAKLKLFTNQDRTNYAIVNYEQPRLKALKNSLGLQVLYFTKHKLSKEYDGAYVDNDELIVRKNGRYVWLGGRDSLSLSGEHNLENSLVAGLATHILGIEADVMRDVLYNFRGLDHRFEMVDVIDGVRFVDDSKATNVDSVRRAIQSSPKGIMLIAGGRDKGGDYKILSKLLKEKVKEVFLIGEAKEKIARAFSDSAPTSFMATLEEAVKAAFGKAKRGDTVLLSPMCSSFDMFIDYKERGEVFRRVVGEVKAECAR